MIEIDEDFIIEKGIEIPAKVTRTGMSAIFQSTLKKMEVGDSFLVKCNPEDTAKIHRIIGNARGYFKRKNPNCIFASRKEEGGIRVWRME